MSSFIGHSLAGLTAYAIVRQFPANRDVPSKKVDRLWLVWLVAIASILDIDYVIPALRVQQGDYILRITHSIVGASIAPICTIFGLLYFGKRGKNLKIKSLQVILAGFSHLLLDLLTGVFSLPLLYPFSTETFRLPFGLLPSAGRIQLGNYLLYRNLFIEIGVIVPFVFSLATIVRHWQNLDVKTIFGINSRRSIAIGLSISACFAIWAFTLDR
jgi:inner membrane protein